MTAGFEARTYAELLQHFQPRTIHNAEQAQVIEQLIDVLLDQPGELTSDERDFLDLLGTLLAEWEDGRYELPSLKPLDILRSLIKDNSLRQRDLVGPVFPTDSIASEVLSGKRNLTYEFVQKLAAFFHVSPALFFEQEDAANDHATAAADQNKSR